MYNICVYMYIFTYAYTHGKSFSQIFAPFDYYAMFFFLPCIWPLNPRGAVQILIIPFFVGVFIVYLVTVFKPDAILTDDQMVEYKKAEKQYFLEKRGAVKDPDAPAEMNQAQRRAARSLKGKRRVRSEWASQIASSN